MTEIEETMTLGAIFAGSIVFIFIGITFFGYYFIPIIISVLIILYTLGRIAQRFGF